MSLADYYRRQREWRAWSSIVDALPPLHGQTVLDLGCGVGDPAAELVARGARVIGLDMNDELLREARSRGLAGAEFRNADLRAGLDVGREVDGVWCSFAAAYFTDLPPALARWTRPLRPGGWLALTEIDDLFGHEPLDVRAGSLLAGYAREALAAQRYDFHMGRKLGDHLEAAGLRVQRVLTLPDVEFVFAGPARPEVLAAWRQRLEGMQLLRQFCGAEFEQVRDGFLKCLASEDHRSLAEVRCCIATKSS